MEKYFRVLGMLVWACVLLLCNRYSCYAYSKFKFFSRKLKETKEDRDNLSAFFLYYFVPIDRHRATLIKIS